MQKIKPFKVGITLNIPRKVGNHIFTLTEARKGSRSFVLTVETSSCQQESQKQQSSSSV